MRERALAEEKLFFIWQLISVLTFPPFLRRGAGLNSACGSGDFTLELGCAELARRRALVERARRAAHRRCLDHVVVTSMARARTFFLLSCPSCVPSTLAATS